MGRVTSHHLPTCDELPGRGPSAASTTGSLLLPASLLLLLLLLLLLIVTTLPGITCSPQHS
jgi:hypothetical protein